MQRYSEVGSLQTRYMEIFGEHVRTDQLETRVLGNLLAFFFLFLFFFSLSPS